MWRMALLALLAGQAMMAGAETRGPQRPNLLLVTVDTTRADRLGCYGYGRGTTPNIDRVAAEAVVVDGATTVIPLTTPSHVSIMTGLHPLSHRVWTNHQRALPEQRTIAEALQSAGYTTAGFVSVFVLDRDHGLDQGFEQFSEPPPVPPPGSPAAPGLRTAGETVDAALKWLQSWSGERFFLWLHLYDPHLPYVPPDEFGLRFNPNYGEYRQRFGELVPADDLESPDAGEGRRPVDGKPAGARQQLTAGADQVRNPRPRPELRLPLSMRNVNVFPRVIPEADVRNMRDAYDGEIAYADSQLGRLLDLLREKRLWDSTAVVVTADHGEILYEHANYFGHHLYMYQGSLKVPLVMKLPGVAPRRIARRITNVDLTPTLLDMLGLSDDVARDGVSYWPLLSEGKPVAGRTHEILVSTGNRPLGPVRGPSGVPRTLSARTSIHVVPPKTGEPQTSRPEGNPTELTLDQAFAFKGVLKGNWKLLQSSSRLDPEGELELYDLASDPEESTNLIAADTAAPVAAELRALLAAAFERVAGVKVSARPTVLDQDAVDKLRALGYAE